MSIGLLLVTHRHIGKAYLETLKATFGQLPTNIDCLEIGAHPDPDKLAEQAKAMCQSLTQGDGVLVLTDVYGSTPSNVCQQLHAAEKVRVVAGMNLPMLFKVINYAHVPLDQLVELAVTAGKEGILEPLNRCEIRSTVYTGRYGSKQSTIHDQKKNTNY